MRAIATLAEKFLKEEDGPTAVEYAVMLAMIIVVVFAAVQFLGQQTSTQFSTVGQYLSDVNS